MERAMAALEKHETTVKCMAVVSTLLEEGGGFRPDDLLRPEHGGFSLEFVAAIKAYIANPARPVDQVRLRRFQAKVFALMAASVGRCVLPANHHGGSSCSCVRFGLRTGFIYITSQFCAVSMGLLHPFVVDCLVPSLDVIDACPPEMHARVSGPSLIGMVFVTTCRPLMLVADPGLGKTACLVGWAIHHLMQSDSATVLLIVPTQAIMWNHANTLKDLCEKTGCGDTLAWQWLVPPDEVAEEGTSDEDACAAGAHRLPFGGQFQVGDKRIGFTVWQGKGHWTQGFHQMAAHEKTETFLNARLVIATADKVHWHLLHRSTPSAFGRRVAANLSAVILDEDHIYEGYFGANMHWLLQRLRMPLYSQGRPPPRFLLATGTVGSPRDLAAALLGCDPSTVDLVKADTTCQVFTERSIAPGVDFPVETDVAQFMRAPERAHSLSRVLWLVDGKLTQELLVGLMDEDVLGSDTRVLTFANSKGEGNQLVRDIKKQAGVLSGRRHVIPYHADLPSRERRLLENYLADGEETDGTTVVGTQALELGVNIAGLHVVLIQHCPTDVMSVFQQLARSGRSPGKYGLVIIGVDSSSLSGRLALEHPEVFFNQEGRQLLIPTDLPPLQLRHLRSCVEEGRYLLGTQGWGQWKDTMLRNNFTQRTDLLEPFTSFDDAAAAMDREAASQLHGAASDTPIDPEQSGDGDAEAESADAELGSQWYRERFRSAEGTTIPVYLSRTSNDFGGAHRYVIWRAMPAIESYL